MNIDVSEYRMHIGLHYCHTMKIKGLARFTNFELLTFLALLLTNCGDIETNPGPASEHSTHSNISLNEIVLREKFSLVHYNVQSLVHKKISYSQNFTILA